MLSTVMDFRFLFGIPSRDARAILPSMNQKSTPPDADPRTTAELIRMALEAPDEDAAWKFIATLEARSDREVLDSALELCRSSDTARRKLGARLLGQLGTPGSGFPDAAFEGLSNLLKHEENEQVLSAIAFALGQLDDSRCLDLLLKLKSHPDAGVRFGVVNGISGQNHPAAIQTLIELSRDEDKETRDWATFGLGTFIDADTPEIRNALAARLDDSCEETANEALVGLARRRDPRALEPLQDALSVEEPDAIHIEAAMAMGDPALLPALNSIKEHLVNQFSAEAEYLDKAIGSCTKTGSDKAGTEGLQGQGT